MNPTATRASRGALRSSARGRSSGSRRRSEHQASYLSSEQLSRAPLLMAVQLSKAQTADLSGQQWEELWADIMGPAAQVSQGRHSLPVPDAYLDDIGYCLKTIGLSPTVERPDAVAHLGADVEVIATRLQIPRASLPRGKRSVDELSSTQLGRRVLAAYNERIELGGWDRYGVLARLNDVGADEGPGYRQYLYWDVPVVPLDPADYSWRETVQSRSSTDCRFNIAACRRPARGSTVRDRADIRYQSAGGQLSLRLPIPEDADIFTVRNEHVLTRAEATASIVASINSRLLG